MRPNVLSLAQVLALGVLLGAPCSCKTGSGKAQPATTRPATGGVVDPIVGPLVHQPSHVMVGLDFLGWTRDGARFVIRATHGRMMGAMSGDDQLVLQQVHDALTGSPDIVVVAAVERVGPTAGRGMRFVPRNTPPAKLPE